MCENENTAGELNLVKVEPLSEREGETDRQTDKGEFSFLVLD